MIMLPGSFGKFALQLLEGHHKSSCHRNLRVPPPMPPLTGDNPFNKALFSFLRGGHFRGAGGTLRFPMIFWKDLLLSNSIRIPFKIESFKTGRMKFKDRFGGMVQLAKLPGQSNFFGRKNGIRLLSAWRIWKNKVGCHVNSWYLIICYTMLYQAANLSYRFRKYFYF